MNSLRYLRRLTALPHRGSGTPQEAEAARICAATLEELGYSVHVQPFLAPRQTLYNGILFLLAAYSLAAVIGSLWLPAVGLGLGLALLVPIVGELTGGRPGFDVFVPKSQSQNVVATSRARPASPTGEPVTAASAPKPHVILTAHMDTQLGSWLFAPAFVRYTSLFFTINYAAIGLILVGLILRTFRLWPSVTQNLQLIAVVIMACGFLFVLFAKLTGRYVNGANDNASGVAIALAIADRHKQEPLPVDLTVLLTGAEEVGERGMKHYMAAEGDQLDRNNTYFVNLDNVGGGILRYQLGEGMVAYYRYSPVLVGLAAHLASGAHLAGDAHSAPADEAHGNAARPVLPLKNTILPTDALIPVRHGFHAITFLAQNEDGTIPNYHWYTDQVDGLDPALVEFTASFVWRYLATLPSWLEIASDA